MHFIIYITYKAIGYVLRGIKTILRPQEFYRAPGSKIPGSATDLAVSLYKSHF